MSPTPEQDAIFSALGDANRRAILALLGQHEELTVGQISSHFGDIGRTAVSGHLRVLRLSGLVVERRDANYRCYSVTSRSADTVVAFLTQVYANSMEQLTNAMENAASNDEQIA